MVTVQQPTGLPSTFWQTPIYNRQTPCTGLLDWPPVTSLFPTPSPSPSPPPLPPIVSPLSVELIKPIGHGSFGVVWFVHTCTCSCNLLTKCSINYCYCIRCVHNPRNGVRSALKKIPSVFQSLLSCIRTFREIKMLCELKHENVSAVNTRN